MAVIIAIALIIFVVMLAFENGGALFNSGPNTTVGKVDGKKIDYQSFDQKLKEVERNLDQRQQQQGYGTLSGAALTQQALEETWNMEVNQIVLENEFNKLGLTIGKKELNDMLFGSNPAQQMRQQFTDPQTGVYDAQAAQQQINEIKKRGTAEIKQQFNEFLNSLELTRLNEKYVALLANSNNYPRWMVEKQNEDESQLAKVSFVRETYASVLDSSQITDKEIEDYISKHKKDFKQPESRSIAYVAFSTAPTANDTAATLSAIVDLKAGFDTTSDAAAFVARNGSAVPYTPIYFGKDQLQQANMQLRMGYKDSILSLPKNAVYGPYLDGSTYVLAKMLDSKILPDSVKCRHILLGTTDRQGQPIMPDSIAKFKADSVALAISRGASFDLLEAQYSTDEAAHQEKGVMTFSSATIQNEGFAKEFGQFILFDGKPGDKKVVKTSFGYHYIEILSFIKPQPHYNIAYMAKPIESSKETIDEAEAEASAFAANSRNQKDFEASAEKLKKEKGLNKNIAINIRPIDAEIQGLGLSRSFVKNIYKARAGEVLQPEKVGDNYVVALVTEAFKEGTMSAAQARLNVEPILRNKRKAEIIRKKLGTISTLEAASAALGNAPIETADSLRMTGSAASVLGFEPKVIGAAFNKANLNKVVPEAIAGAQGVYVIRVDDLSATPVADANIAEKRKSRYQQAKMQVMYQQSPLQALREAAKIKDNRADIY